MENLPPHSQFYPDLRLFHFRPLGILSEDQVDLVVAKLELEEERAEKPFDRFTDLSRLDAIDLNFQYVFRVSLHRRLTYAKYLPVKSAFYVTSPAAARIVKMHAILTEHSPLQVAMFEEMTPAATWLNVPLKRLVAES